MVVEAKICGLTRPEDAALAARHGAARLGVIFAGGRRLISNATAREIIAAAEGVPVLGVFGSQSTEEILNSAGEAGLAGVQLHRASSLAEANALRQAGLEVWRVFFVLGEAVDTPSLLEAASGADLVLLEPSHPEGGGGHGRPWPVDVARQARAVIPQHRVGLAGGLTPESVSEAIRVVRPDLVDVSSGVEESPGIKDPARLVRFLENVRDAGSAP